MAISASSAVEAGTYAMPIAFLRNGVCVPLVTTPTGSPSIEDGIAVPGDGAVEHLEADQPARDSGGLLRGQGVAADEVAFGPGHDPLEIGLEHAGGVVDVVAVEPHRRLEPQRVARSQARRAQVDRPARVDQRVPHARGVLRRHEHLVAIFAGVPGARDRGPHPGDLAGGKPVVLHPQIGARQGLQHLARGRALQRQSGRTARWC